MLTLNRKHFIRLHQVSPDHAGVVVCTFDPDFVRQAQLIHEALDSDSPTEGKLLRVYRPG